MTSPSSPAPPRSPGFYLFRSHSSIRPPTPYSPSPSTSTSTSLISNILPHLIRHLMRSATGIILPVVLLPFHFLLLILSVMTTIVAFLFLWARAFMVYIDIGFNTASQVYSDYAFGGKRIGRRRRDLLRRVVLEREQAVRVETEQPKQRGRGATEGFG